MMRTLLIVLGCLGACGGKVDPGPPVVALSSLAQSCDGLTGQSTVDAVLPRYEGVFAAHGKEPPSWQCSNFPDAGPNPSSGVPYTMKVSYAGGAITCHHGVDEEGANGAHYHMSGMLEVVMHVEMSTADGALASESFDVTVQNGTSYGWASTGVGPCGGDFGNSPYHFEGAEPAADVKGSLKSDLDEPFMKFTGTFGRASEGLTTSGAGHASGDIGSAGFPDGKSVKALASFMPK